MKVIAINNAPNVDTDYSWAKKFNIERAYVKGDIFNTRTSPDYNKLLVIFNHYVNDWMEVNPENFQSLEEWREKQINKIIK